MVSSSQTASCYFFIRIRLASYASNSVGISVPPDGMSTRQGRPGENRMMSTWQGRPGENLSPDEETYL